MKKIVRPEWNCGRYFNDNTSSYALLYNLIDGMSYFFEDDSADLIGEILKIPRNTPIDLEKLNKSLNFSFELDDIINFCDELISVGILTEGVLTNEIIKNNRELIGDLRKKESFEIEKTVQEKLPFIQNDAESAYMEILEKNNVPFVVMLELTYNCNEKCVHCFNPGAARNDNEKSFRNEREEINLNHYENLLNDLESLGVVKIILTGGDPFVKKDIWTLIEMIYNKGFAVDIYTNGLALIGRVEKLANFYPRSIGLSIYSADNEIHDSITKVRGSLRKTLIVADDLIKFGIPMYFKCPIMHHNSKSYFTIVELAKKYGAIPQIDITLTDSVDGDTAISEQLQVDGELLEIILRDPNIPLYVGKEAPNFGKQERDKSQPFCGAGTALMNITPEGDITPCNSFPTQFGNLKDKSFLEVWYNSKTLHTWQKTVLSDYDECGTHDRCGYCNRCPGQSFIEHGTPLKASTANCYFANARMNLANKLKKGIDPLNGDKLENVLANKSIETNIEIISNKNNTNFRNKVLDIKAKS